MIGFKTFTFSQPVALSLRAAFYAAFVMWLPMPWPVTCCAFYEVFLTAYVYFDIFFIYTWQALNIHKRYVAPHSCFLDPTLCKKTLPRLRDSTSWLGGKYTQPRYKPCCRPH